MKTFDKALFRILFSLDVQRDLTRSFSEFSGIVIMLKHDTVHGYSFLYRLIIQIDRVFSIDNDNILFVADPPKRVPYPLSAYVLIEVEKARFNEVYPKLYFLDNVVSCDTTKGKYDLILLIQSATFNEMERLVREKIGSIDGIVRTRLLNIMNLFEM